MKTFFELGTDEQLEMITNAIEKRKKERYPLKHIEKKNHDPYVDLIWKSKELSENYNPIPIPINVKFRTIKRVIGKLIRTYTRKQVNFNQSVMAFLNLTIRHFKDLDSKVEKMKYMEDKNAQLEALCNDLNVKMKIVENKQMKELERINDLLVSEIKLLNERNDSLHNEIESYISISKQLEMEKITIDRTLEEMKSANSEKWEQLSTLKEWIAGVEKDSNGSNNWLKIIDARVSQIEQFQHKTRKEMFAELKYAQSNYSMNESKSQFISEILNPQKIDLIKKSGKIKVNLGCGTFAKDDYINVDMRDLEGVDIIADVRDLPIEKGTVEELYLSHVIEHFPEVDMEKYILPYWRTLLSPGGRIRIICPDWEAMLLGYSKGEISLRNLKEITFGSQEYNGNQHFNMFTPASLVEMMKTAGFEDIKIIDVSRKNGMCLEMEIEGVR